jgi:hypothetical protein
MFRVHFYPKREIETTSVVVVLLCFFPHTDNSSRQIFSSIVLKWIPCLRFLQLFFDLPKVDDSRRRDNVSLSRPPPTAPVSFFPGFSFLNIFFEPSYINLEERPSGNRIAVVPFRSIPAPVHPLGTSVWRLTFSLRTGHPNGIIRAELIT